jgi:hypothetical protein
MAVNQVWDKNGNLVSSETVPDPVPQIPADFAQLTVSELLSAFVAEGALTQTRMNNILNRLKR